MKLYKLFYYFLTFVSIVLLVFALLNYFYFNIDFTERVLYFGYVGIFIFSFLTEFFPQAILSPHAFMLGAILFSFDFHLSLLLAVFGSIFGSMLGYEFGASLNKRLVHRISDEKSRTETRRWLIHGEKIIFVLAAITPIPFTPMIFGSLGTNRFNFWIYGVLSRALGIILSAAVFLFFFGTF